MAKKGRASKKSTEYSSRNISKKTPGRNTPGNYPRLLIAFSALSVYTLLLWGNVPYISSLGSAYLALIKKIVGIQLPHYKFWVLVSGAHFFLVPLIVGRLVLKMPFGKMGLRGISIYQIKVLVMLYLLAIPFLMWLATREGMYSYYEPYIKKGLWEYLIWTNLVMFFEHSSLQGILLSILEPTFFEAPVEGLAKTEEGKESIKGRIREKQWVKAIRDWLRIDRYYFLVFLLDGILFMLIHLGKPVSEMFIAFPGGVFLAFLSFKFKSFLPCYLIHTMIAGTIIFLITSFH
jgi:hypothetical protein